MSLSGTPRPRKGLCAFELRRWISSGAALLAFALFLLAVQAMTPQALGGASLFLLLGNLGALKGWWRHVWRAKWLLLTTWLLVAYHTPGELWWGMAWAPSEEGVYDATWQAVRLVVMLGCLALLFAHFTRQEVVAGLFRLLHGGRYLGCDVRRLVVRLALVLDNLERGGAPANWREMLLHEAEPVSGGDHLLIESAPGKPADLVLLPVMLFLLWMLH